MPLTSQNLIWVKNIIRDQGHNWAYMDAEYNDEFVLQFSPKFARGAGNAQQGDVILLFQKMKIRGYRKLFLTHLVTPATNQIVDDPEEQYPIGRLVKVVARPPLTGLIPKPEYLSFFKPNRGGCCGLELIGRLDGVPIQLDVLRNTIWELFEDHIRPEYKYIPTVRSCS